VLSQVEQTYILQHNINKHCQGVEMTDNNHKSRNVKLSEELIEAIKKRAPDAPPGETLLAIYKEYEYLETVARRVTGADENDNINISEAIERFFKDIHVEMDHLRKSHDDFKLMLQGIQLALNAGILKP